MRDPSPPLVEPDRTALRETYRAEENACVAQRLADAAPASAVHSRAAAIAAGLIDEARAKKASGIDAFLQSYGLDTEEGVALMCLAEALLRVPDSTTADALIRDKIEPIDWKRHVGTSGSTFVEAATFSLMLTGEVLERPEAQQTGLAPAFRRALGRLGEPVIRQAVGRAMRILGGQFVFGRDIEEALRRAAPERREGLTHSFDMLGEAAMTMADAERYRASYETALRRLAEEAGEGVTASPGISVKLSALYPKYDWMHGAAAVAHLVPVVRELAAIARDADIHFTIDAEEAERLDLSLDIFAALAADDALFARADGSRWEGFGLAVQAYQKRAVSLCDWIAELARLHDRRFFVRLVKGAYWDSEIKLAQVGGLADYPVFTRKLGTDVSYLACAHRLIAAEDAVRPAFATHNAYTIGAIRALAEEAGRAPDGYEFQRLHGMGEEVYDALRQRDRRAGNRHTPVRIYAPVGGHKDLLAYLVRRLLENGANSSFVNRMADAEVPAAELTRDPVAELAAMDPYRNPAIPLPGDIFPNRANSAGIDLSDTLVREPLLELLDALAERQWDAVPTLGEGGEPVAIRSPQDHDDRVGTMRPATEADVARMAERAAQAQPGWNALDGDRRGALLEAAADALEADSDAILSLCVREAGKTLPDAVLELREAVDFLRFYAGEARRLFMAPVALPGPTGEKNRLSLHGRGVWATIAPWNFPLAIFLGPAAAALAAGNTVLAKPAEQTPLIAARAIALCHRAGIPEDVLQLVPGDGATGVALTSQPEIAGVAFTGSTETARAINRALAARDGPIAQLIAETGGQNALLVDSSALPEQVTRDVVASAFQSAGQRCSALRVLYLQEDIAEGMLAMIRGAFELLTIGDPADPATDLGPVIDAEAKQTLDDHVDAMRAAGRRVWQRDLPDDARGSFVAPAIIEIDSIADLEAERFGPVLHVARFPAGGIDAAVRDINAAGFGLTLGLHSRIAETQRLVERTARVGNLYINRNQIGAVVESQPFGGEGLSGTGPKAGGPNYVARFATERVVTIDTTAAGGNATLLAS